MGGSSEETKKILQMCFLFACVFLIFHWVEAGGTDLSSWIGFPEKKAVDVIINTI